jgi:hypothetical protein
MTLTTLSSNLVDLFHTTIDDIRPPSPLSTPSAIPSTAADSMPPPDPEFAEGYRHFRVGLVILGTF